MSKHAVLRASVSAVARHARGEVSRSTAREVLDKAWQRELEDCIRVRGFEAKEVSTCLESMNKLRLSTEGHEATDQLLQHADYLSHILDDKQLLTALEAKTRSATHPRLLSAAPRLLKTSSPATSLCAMTHLSRISVAIDPSFTTSLWHSFSAGTTPDPQQVLHFLQLESLPHDIHTTLDKWSSDQRYRQYIGIPDSELVAVLRHAESRFRSSVLKACEARAPNMEPCALFQLVGVLGRDTCGLARDILTGIEAQVTRSLRHAAENDLAAVLHTYSAHRLNKGTLLRWCTRRVFSLLKNREGVVDPVHLASFMMSFRRFSVDHKTNPNLSSLLLRKSCLVLEERSTPVSAKARLLVESVTHHGGVAMLDCFSTDDMRRMTLDDKARVLSAFARHHRRDRKVFELVRQHLGKSLKEGKVPLDVSVRVACELRVLGFSYSALSSSLAWSVTTNTDAFTPVLTLRTLKLYLRDGDKQGHLISALISHALATKHRFTTLQGCSLVSALSSSGTKYTAVVRSLATHICSSPLTGVPIQTVKELEANVARAGAADTFITSFLDHTMQMAQS